MVRSSPPNMFPTGDVVNAARETSFVGTVHRCGRYAGSMTRPITKHNMADRVNSRCAVVVALRWRVRSSRSEGSVNPRAKGAEDKRGGSTKMLIDAVFGVVVVMFAVLGWWLLEHLDLVQPEVDVAHGRRRPETN